MSEIFAQRRLLIGMLTQGFCKMNQVPSDNSLIGGLLLALVLVALSTLISYLTYKSRIASMIFEGTPTLLIHKGKLIPKHLAKERMSESDLKILLRKQGLHHIAEIETAILEADGTLSATKICPDPKPA